MFQSWTYWASLAASVLVYWQLPMRARPLLLLLVSLAYLYSLDPLGVTGLGVWVLAFLAIGWRLRERDGESSSALALAAIVGLLAYLAWYKYLPELAPGLGLDGEFRDVVAPLGISFITFRLIHYLVEVQRGSLPAYRPLDFLAYAFFFPIWTAGPIHRFDAFKSYADGAAPRFDKEDLRIGLNRIINGLIKKFVVADQLLPRLFGPHASARELIDRLAGASTLEVWWFLAVSFLILYMDFSGYSDMAIGSARLFGIRVLENFNFPVLARNVSEYWKRWHMSLANWCQSYVYMPVIAHSRQPYLAVFATFSIMGIWHAGSWHWLFWGLHHALGISLHRLWAAEKRRRQWTWFSQGFSRHLALPLTLLWVMAAGAFTTVHQVGSLGDSFRILARAVVPSFPAGTAGEAVTHGD
ncbi:MBOAT family O-acyltransferase [Roseateles cavernae]|uniref:MBOAT family O-acyltransferase n=1 Tax=Roseateles cavernae TaxID=3153578 RepID=UPI0032E36AE9